MKMDATGNISSTQEEFVISRMFNAPRKQVWSAWTEREQLMRWFGPQGFTISHAALDLHVGGIFHYAMRAPDGSEMWGKWTFCEIASPKKLVLINSFSDAHGGITRHPMSRSWPLEMLSTTTFEAVGNKTKLSIRWAPCNATELERKTFAEAVDSMEQGWNGTFAQLEAYLEGQIADTADREIVVSRTFEAPRELVWEAMANPQHVVNWWGPNGFTTTIEKMDFRVGGVWKHVMRGPDGTDYPNSSVFEEIVKPERIVYSHGGGKAGGPAAHFTATWTFETLGKQTRLTMRSVFDTAADRDLVVKEYGAIEGGKQTLARLDAYLAKMPAGTGQLAQENILQIQPYLFFDGRCEEAIEFYHHALGAEVTMLMRYKDSPEPQQPGMIPPGAENKVMHASLKIGEAVVMASDGMCLGKPAFQGVSLSLTVKNDEEAERSFAALSDGGQVQMPLTKTFFSSRFGMVADRFGVSWMIIVAQ